jgi:tRNA pseudouridine38-40 synthase
LNTYKIKISYIGCGYEGWQIQPLPSKTIQRELNKALEVLTKGQKVTTIASGRTDSGVHALGQVVKATLPFPINAESLIRGLNSHLPSEIRVLMCEECDETFHPVRDALSKTYRYLLFEGDVLPPLLIGRVTLVRPGVDWPLLEKGIERFIGEKNFVNFSTKGTLVSTTVREIFSSQLITGSVSNISGLDFSHPKLREIQFKGSGFLKQMVRLLVGSALIIGRGKRDASELEYYFDDVRNDKFGPVAPPDGLYLDTVEY